MYAQCSLLLRNSCESRRGELEVVSLFSWKGISETDLGGFEGSYHGLATSELEHGDRGVERHARPSMGRERIVLI